MSRKDDENLTVLSTSLAPIRARNAPFRRSEILTSDSVFFVIAGLECAQSRCLTAMLCPRFRLALKRRHRECGRAMTLDAGGKGIFLRSVSLTLQSATCCSVEHPDIALNPHLCESVPAFLRIWMPKNSFPPASSVMWPSPWKSCEETRPSPRAARDVRVGSATDPSSDLVSGAATTGGRATVTVRARP